MTGANFTGATSVAFGSVLATSFRVLSDTTITVTAPARAPAIHGILVTTPAGTSAADPSSYFTYKLPVPPAVTAISPASGPTTGGTVVTITGTGFDVVTRVAFGSVAATSFRVLSDTKIVATAPPQGASIHGIIVTTGGGASAAVVAAYFTYKK